MTAAGCVHEPMVTGGGKAAVERPEFRWVNTILGTIKNALRGTYWFESFTSNHWNIELMDQLIKTFE